ncbi:FUSC family protein [Streptomyces sp. NPDC091292]|uniref:FUSC family protein n=1 Tax=Streptomyces sp. NPDC091292 TaxID=3365991 RepID=UPI0038126DB2
MRARTPTPPPPPASVRSPRSVPPWLGHALRTQRGPVPWSAVVRGALAAGPLLLLAVLAGRPTAGVAAALGAMFAGINDRPGSRHASAYRIGVPALAGATGLLIGSYAAGLRGGEGPALLVTLGLTALLAGLGLIGGALSAIGPVASGAGTQLLVAAAAGVGMPLPEPPAQRALLFLAGAGWLLTLRLALPSPGARGLDIERAAVAAVYDAVAALLRAAGGADAVARRVALTAALDQAQDALRGPRPLRPRRSGAERKLHAQYVAALPLAEAATALAWRGAPLPARAADGPTRLAAAVRDARPCGPLPAPARSTAALRALDDALLHAADAFDTGTTAHAPVTVGAGPALRTGFRRAVGPAGREYGVRVALCLGVSTAVAQSLHHPHWYWLPATAVFLVKPDLGPLASRVLCRALGTLLGAGLFAGLAALVPTPYGTVGVVAVAGALIPVGTRHFAAQTAVVTVLVLGLVQVGGEPQAAAGRIGETLLACAIVLIVGHLPLPGQRGHGVRARLAVAARAADDYLGHVLGGSDDRAASWALRRDAYRSLAQVRAAAALSAAELTVLARHTAGTAETAARLELLVDATTATAVHLNDGPRPPAAL